MRLLVIIPLLIMRNLSQSFRHLRGMPNSELRLHRIAYGPFTAARDVWDAAHVEDGSDQGT